MSIVRCSRLNTPLQAMDRECGQGQNESTTAARRVFKTLILTVCQQGLNAGGQGESREPIALDPFIPCHTPSTAVLGWALIDHVYNMNMSYQGRPLL